ncbi:cyclophilin-like protein [Coccomyxa subellipsoidea C-169]|uniref:peptidylprolyl isomerase n=1 Tax=Coccomyxa subellipsoidea (strain C-169) TaxID=574566 RepID=I0Z1E7_COCSC|nr:cyclophilin-like protein [Coccomyxa subellipsoidea C-169]EIE24466.1 cyclophilin-like protein [Coccomyxa subellipsoidea C-169]|eukprot:XP_005649010.1 cyclophilin-like protein [Coccomyxa subellipsoidea C-169]
MPQAEARLTAGDPVKNARALLRYALPIKNDSARRIQARFPIATITSLEGISEQLRIPGSKALGPISSAVRKSKSVLNNDKAKIIADFAPQNKEAGLRAIAALDKSLDEFTALLDAKDKQEIPIKQQEALGFVGQVEEAMVKGFPYEVPAQYANLPQLKGRATVDMKIKLKEVRNDGVEGGNLRIVVDGFNAPVTAGDFVDLVSRGFYTGMEIQRADGFIVQTGDPGPPDFGFREGDHVRRIPFEVMVKGDKAPFYEETLEDAGRFNDEPVLPFNAYGTMALARGEFEANSGSSQVFWLLKESELTPSGANLLDGRYAVFGYVVEGQDLLTQLQVGDLITEAKVVDGLEFLQAPKVT